jgi:hypothetical protein
LEALRETQAVMQEQISQHQRQFGQHQERMDQLTDQMTVVIGAIGRLVEAQEKTETQ